MNRLTSTVLASAVVFGTLAGCAAKVRYVPGTKVPYSDLNKSVLAACEDYRLAVERKDVDALLLMADKQYWEDSGTPSGSDDYGYEGLRTVLQTRLGQASEIRYSLRYMTVSQQCKGELEPGCKATVDVLIDASYTINNVSGKTTRLDKRDQNQLYLTWNGSRWLFIAGM